MRAWLNWSISGWKKCTLFDKITGWAGDYTLENHRAKTLGHPFWRGARIMSTAKCSREKCWHTWRSDVKCIQVIPQLRGEAHIHHLLASFLPRQWLCTNSISRFVAFFVILHSCTVPGQKLMCQWALPHRNPAHWRIHFLPSPYIHKLSCPPPLIARATVIWARLLQTESLGKQHNSEIVHAKGRVVF